MEDILEQLGITPSSVQAGINGLFENLSSNLGPGLTQTMSGDLSGGISSLMKGTGQLTAQLTKKGINSTYALTGKLMASATKKTWDSVNYIMTSAANLMKTTLTTGTESAMNTLQETMSSMKDWWDSQAGDLAKLTGVSLADMESAVNAFAASMQAQGLSSQVDPEEFKNQLANAVNEGMSFDQAKVAAEQAAVLESSMGGLGEAMLPTFNRLLANANTMGLDSAAAMEYAKEQTQLVADSVYANQKEFGGALVNYSKSSEALLSSASTLNVENLGGMLSSLSTMDATFNDFTGGIGSAMSDIVAQIATGDQGDMVNLITSLGIGATNQEEFIQAFSQDSEGTMKAVMNTLTEFTASGSYSTDAMAEVFGVSVETMRVLQSNGDSLLSAFEESSSTQGTDRVADATELVATQISDSNKIANATATEVMANFSGNVASLQEDTISMLGGLGDIIGGPLGMVVNAVLQLGMVGPEAAKAIIGQIENMLIELPNMVTNIVNGISETIPVLMGMVPGLISALAAAIPEVLNALLGVLPVLIEGLGTALLILGQQLPVILPPILESVLGAVFSLLPQLLSTVLTDILPALLQSVLNLVHELPDMLRDLAANLPEPWGQLFETVASIIEMLTPILDAIFEAVMDLIPVVMDIVTELMPILVNIIDAVMAIVTPIIEPILMITTALLNFLMPLITNLLDMLLPLISGVLDLVIPVLTRIFEAIMPIMTIVLQIAAPILQAVFDIFGKVWDVIYSLIGPAIGFVSEILEWMSNRWPFKGNSPDREETDQSEAVVEIKALDLEGLNITTPEPLDTTTSLTTSSTYKATGTESGLVTSTTAESSTISADLSSRISDLSVSATSMADSSTSMADSIVMFHPALVSLLSYLETQESQVAYTIADVLGTSNLELASAIQSMELTLPPDYTEAQLAYQTQVLEKFDLTIKELKELIDLLRESRSIPPRSPQMGSKPTTITPVGSLAALRKG